MLDENSGVAHKRKDELALMRLEFELPEQKYLSHDIPLYRNSRRRFVVAVLPQATNVVNQPDAAQVILTLTVLGPSLPLNVTAE